MISIARKPGESVSIGGAVVTVQEVGPTGARLLVSAPLSVPVKRSPAMPRTGYQPLYFALGGHELRGVYLRGRWTFSCPSWPALAAAHEGCESPEPLVEEFQRRALGLLRDDPAEFAAA